MIDLQVNVNGEKKHYRTVWFENGIVKTINQLKLPYEFEIIELKSYQEVGNAIKNMTVRGAGAIGAIAGYGILLAVLNADEKKFENEINVAAKFLKSTRPTAYDLFYSVDKMLNAVKKSSPAERKMIAFIEAEKLAQNNVDACRTIGEFGEKLIKKNAKILTHCNAGWLAFADWGSALSPIYMAKRKGKNPFVFVDETRPRFQGAKLTAWELENEGVKHAVITDNAAGYFMQKGEVDIAIVGADRIASNGDTANKIGTYEKAVLAKENGLLFYVAAPLSTFDFKCKSGKEIKIEERNEKEVLEISGWNGNEIKDLRIANEKSGARNPSFDVTPAKYVSGFITEKGIFKANELKKIMRNTK